MLGDSMSTFLPDILTSPASACDKHGRKGQDSTMDEFEEHRGLLSWFMI